MLNLNDILVKSFTLARRRIGFVYALVVLCALGCQPIGGLNTNQKQPGSGDEGVDLAWGEIAVDPQGKYFVSSMDNGLLMVELDSGNQKEILEGFEPARLAFANTSQTIILAGYNSTNKILIAYDVAENRVRWKKTLQSRWESFFSFTRSQMTVTKNDAYLIIVSDRDLQIRKVEDGTIVLEREFDRTIMDMDLVNDERVLITLEEEWEDQLPVTSLVSISLTTGMEIDIQVPNCSDELIVAVDAKLAFLAPTTCVQPESNRNKDPVSVIDLEANEFVRNLPGFGPVALNDDETRVVAFMDMDNLDRDLFDSLDDIPSREGMRYHLMFIDVQTLSFSTLALGNALPRYALTPDGKMLLIDEKQLFRSMRMRVLDIDNGEMQEIIGPDVKLDNFVITSDSRMVYLLYSGLFELTLSDALVRSVDVSFTPYNINITPDDRYLILRESPSRLWFYDIENRHIARGIELTSQGSIRIEVEAEISISVN